MDYYAYLKSREWQFKRQTALDRAGYRCQVCNRSSTDVTLEVHHRTYERLGDELPDDLTVLCRDCHELFSKNGKLAKSTEHAKAGSLMRRLLLFTKRSASWIATSVAFLIFVFWGLGSWSLGYQTREPPAAVRGYTFDVPLEPGLSEAVILMSDRWTVLACATEDGFRAVATKEMLFREVTALQLLMRAIVVPIAQNIGMLPKDTYDIYTLEGKPTAEISQGTPVEYCLIDAFEDAGYVNIGFASNENSVMIEGFHLSRDESAENPEFVSWLRREMVLFD